MLQNEKHSMLAIRIQINRANIFKNILAYIFSSVNFIIDKFYNESCIYEIFFVAELH